MRAHAEIDAVFKALLRDGANVEFDITIKNIIIAPSIFRPDLIWSDVTIGRGGTCTKSACEKGLDVFQT